MQLYELTAYDATYLELAMRLNLPLATLDLKLLSAARQAGVSLLGST
jgi:predicted nucleic acid-binding protein